MRHAVSCYDSHTMESVLHAYTYFDSDANFQWRPRPFLPVPNGMFPHVHEASLSCAHQRMSTEMLAFAFQLTPVDTALGNEWHVESSLSAAKTIAAMDAISAFDPIDFVIQENKYYGMASCDGANYESMLQLFKMMYSRARVPGKREDIDFDTWLNLVVKKMADHGVVGEVEHSSPPHAEFLLYTPDTEDGSQESILQPQPITGCKRKVVISLL